MSTRWHDDIVYLGVMAALFLIAVAVYVVLKRFGRRDRDGTLFAKVESWVDGIFATALLGALIFITVRYS